jgi:hypothetical protein
LVATAMDFARDRSSGIRPSNFLSIFVCIARRIRSSNKGPHFYYVQNNCVRATQLAEIFVAVNLTSPRRLFTVNIWISNSGFLLACVLVTIGNPPCLPRYCSGLSACLGTLAPNPLSPLTLFLRRDGCLNQMDQYLS